MGDWQGKVVAVTGASDGLGWEIASAFARKGATPVCLARNAERLEEATERIRQTGAQAVGVPCDVTDDESVRVAFEQIASDFGRLDGLVNNVGISARGDVKSVPLERYRELWEVNFLATVRCTQAALPKLLEAKGHCVNIGSLASKTAWPYMAPYSASKFAVAAYTHQLRLECGPKLHALLVCPGPLRRADAGTRYAKEAADLPEQARQPGAGADLKGIEPRRLAQRIVRACEKRQAELILPAYTRWLFVISQISPKLGDWILRSKMK